MIRAAILAVVGLSALALGSVACDGDSGNGNTNNNTGLPCLAQFGGSSTERTCVFQTLSEVSRTPCGDVWENCDASGISTPNLACVGQPENPPPNPPTVTLQGYLDVFSAGPEPVDVVVQVYAAADLQGVTRIDSSVLPLGEVTITQTQLEADIASGTARACFVEKDDIGNNQVECPQPTGDCSPACQDTIGGSEFCFQANCHSRLRYEGRYRIPNIPTWTQLVVRTSGVNGPTDDTWGVMTQVNVYLRTTDPEYDGTAGTYEHDANVLSRQDWSKIPTILGLAGGISAGRGAIAGEVQDCDGVRLSGAQVGLLPQSPYFAYFNGNPLDTVPLTARLSQGTNLLGIYAEFELPPGVIDVEAWGLVGGVETLLGTHQTNVFEDSVTVLGINAGNPSYIAPMP